ncbi:MAG TPA: hypothetical protein VFR67_12005 [Pilimelia sp.]|nr:hypothetical protein [Pilimelia sp.]
MATARGAARLLKVLGLVFGAAVVAIVYVLSQDPGGGTVVPGPSAADSQAAAAQLAQASKRQGVCYGWVLSDSFRTVSRGSNLGDNVPVDSDTGRCGKWVEVRAQVIYEPESSEAADSATVSVVGSPSLRLDPDLTSRLDQLGLAEGAFIDDPGSAICRAALALPLLVAEAGAAKPAPAPSGVPTATPRPLAAAGSDFWRDRWLFVVVAGLIGLAALFLMVIGLVERRAQRSARRPRGMAGGSPPATPAEASHQAGRPA